MKGFQLAQVFALLFSIVDGAASCQQYSNNRGSSLGFCAGIVDYEYFSANASYTQGALEMAALNSITNGNPLVEQLFLLLPGECGQAMRKAACLATFPRCNLIDPFFLNKCQGTCASGTCGDNISCANAPGAVVGSSAGATWVQALAGNADVCTENGLVKKSGSCYKVIPTFPCREDCYDITTMETKVGPDSKLAPAGKCPLISGFFYSSLMQLKAQNSDPVVIQQIDDTLATQGSNPAGIYPVNLLQAFGFAPNCSKTISMQGLDVSVFTATGSKNMGAIGELIAANIGLVADGNQYKAAAQFSLECVVKATPQASATYAVAAKDSVCSSVLGSDTNQDATLNYLLGLKRYQSTLIATGDATKAATCASEQTRENSRLYYVASFPGLPQLSPAIDELNKESEAEDLTTKCSPLEGNVFANLGADQPLCSDASGTSFYNSRDCLDAKISDTLNSFPEWAPYRCSSAFKEMACAKAQMKIELKEFCMVPGGCTANGVFGYQFAIPRFPARALCEKVNTECADLIKIQPSLKIECENTINIDKCSNEQLASNPWGCTNSLNGKLEFPVDFQVYVDIAAQIPSVELYLNAVGQAISEEAKSALALSLKNAFQTSVVQPTETSSYLYDTNPNATTIKDIQLDTCNCPYPLVVPDDPNPELSVSPSTCCALPCRGSMSSEKDMEYYDLMETVLSSIAIVGLLFMLLTWGFFKEKQKQYMTFWLTVCAFNVSLGFFVMSSTSGGSPSSLYCKDNSQGVKQSDGFTRCAFQAIWLAFFALSECCWWFVQAFDLYLKLVRETRNTDMNKRRYHLFCWLPPFVCAIILLSAGALGFYGPNVWCFINGDAPKWLEWACFYGFIVLLVIGGVYCMFRVIYVIVDHTNKSGSINGSTNQRWKTKVKMYKTPILFVMLFIFVWTNIFVFRFNSAFSTGSYQEDAAAWIQCLLGNFLFMDDPATNPNADVTSIVTLDSSFPLGEGCGIVQPNGLPIGQLKLTQLVVMSQGILVFLVFGANPDNFRLWGEKLGICSPRDRHFGDTSEQSFSKGSFEMNSSKGPTTTGSFYNNKNEGAAVQSQVSSYTSFEDLKVPAGAPPMPPNK